MRIGVVIGAIKPGQRGSWGGRQARNGLEAAGRAGKWRWRSRKKEVASTGWHFKR